MPGMERTRNTSATADSDFAPLLRNSGPHRPAEFSGGRRIGEFVVLGWETAVGKVGVAYAVGDSGGGVRPAREDLRDFDCLVTVGSDLNLDQVPSLEAVDMLPRGRFSPAYEPTWSQLAAVLGGKAPWFHHYLRDPATILEWKPGYPPALVSADDPELPTASLALLALDEPDGSPAAAVCTSLARQLRRRAAEQAAETIAQVIGNAAEQDEYVHELDEDRAFVGIGALPAPLARQDEPCDSELEQMVKLAGWAQITERRDTLAHAVADTVLRWDGGKDWPHGESIELYPDRCRIAAEWVEALDPAPGDVPPTVAERRLLSGRSEHEDPLLLHDLATAAPAVGHTDDRGELTVTATCPQRIPSLAPLSEVILSHGAVWIRTDDGRLWLAPNATGGPGLSWGHDDDHAGGGSGDGRGGRGGGSSSGNSSGNSSGSASALADLVDKLLDDITAPAVRDHGTPPQGLRELIEATPRQGTTRYGRAQLLAAR